MKNKKLYASRIRKKTFFLKYFIVLISLKSMLSTSKGATQRNLQTRPQLIKKLSEHQINQSERINCSSSVATDAPAIYLAGQPIPNSKNVKNLVLVLNNAFSWKNQVKSICICIYCSEDFGALHHTHLLELGGS
jgi:hypothetical protein